MLLHTPDEKINTANSTFHDRMLTGHVIATAISSASGSKTATGSSHKPTGTSGSTLVSMYPTGSSGQGSSNGTVPAATGGPKPSGSATGSGGLPEATGAAGKVEFGLAAVVAGLMVAAL